MRVTLNPRFKGVSARTSATSIQLDENHYVTIIVPHAPTLGKSQQKSQQNFHLRETFHNELNSFDIDTKNDKHLLLVLGKFHAQSGYRIP